MGLELDLRVQRLSSLPPIQTSRAGAKPVEGKDVLASKPGAVDQKVSAECITPKFEQSSTPKRTPPPPIACPPAPRKPRPAKRKFSLPVAEFYEVPSDLAAVFVPIPQPPIARVKKIRVC